MEQHDVVKPGVVCSVSILVAIILNSCVGFVMESENGPAELLPSRYITGDSTILCIFQLLFTNESQVAPSFCNT
jgi:hypothetical protein